MQSGIDKDKMRLPRLTRRWPIVGIAYTAMLVGAYIWWILQSPQQRLAVLTDSSTDLAHLQHAPWLVLPASSIWSGNFIAYWAIVVLLCLGALERLRGTLATVLIGVVAHVVSTGVSEGITAARIAAGDLSANAGHVLDVGPSYVVAACAAAVVASPGASRWLRLACGLTLLPLVVTALADFSAESQVAAIGHAVAMLIGVAAGRSRAGLRPAARDVIDTDHAVTQR
jgi:hypothetical protein